MNDNEKTVTVTISNRALVERFMDSVDEIINLTGRVEAGNCPASYLVDRARNHQRLREMLRVTLEASNVFDDEKTSDKT